MDETIATLPKRRKRNPVEVPAEVLIDVLRHFSRRMLTRKMSWVNSQFYRLSRQHVPVIHMIAVLNFDHRNRDMFCPSTDLRGSDMVKMPIPASYIRIHTIEVHPGIFHIGESAFNFLKSAKHIFVGAYVYFRYNIGDVPNIPHDLLEHMELLLNEVFTDPYFISFYGNCFVPKRLFQTKGVLNCDKVERFASLTEMWQYSGRSICNAMDSKLYGIDDSFDVAKCFGVWLLWKHKEANSRRHLILKDYPKDTAVELVDVLKKAFQKSTTPLNYTVTFVGSMQWHKYTIANDDTENNVTGERLSLFSFQRTKGNSRPIIVHCLWRRIPIEDSPGKTCDADFVRMLKRECAPNQDFDRKFHSVSTRNH